MTTYETCCFLDLRGRLEMAVIQQMVALLPRSVVISRSVGLAERHFDRDDMTIIYRAVVGVDEWPLAARRELKKANLWDESQIPGNGAISSRWNDRSLLALASSRQPNEQELKELSVALVEMASCWDAAWDAIDTANRAFAEMILPASWWHIIDYTPLEHQKNDGQ